MFIPNVPPRVWCSSPTCHLQFGVHPQCVTILSPFVLFGVHPQCATWYVSVCAEFGVFFICAEFGVFSICAKFGVFSICAKFGVHPQCAASLCRVWGSPPTCFVENACTGLMWYGYVHFLSASGCTRIAPRLLLFRLLPAGVWNSLPLTFLTLVCYVVHWLTYTHSHIHTHNACVQPHTYMHASTNACTVMHACARTTVAQKPQFPLLLL